MSDLKSDFSDETDESDFSASEDDWKPNKSELIGASGSDDTDFEEVPEAFNSKKGKSGPLSTKKPKITTTKRTVKPVRNMRSLRSTVSPQPSSSNGLAENLKASSYENNLSSSSSENSNDEDLIDVKKNSNNKSSYVPTPQYWSTFEDKEEFDASPKSEYKFENLKVIEQYEKTKECFNSYKKSECIPKVDVIPSNDDGDDISKLLAMGEKSAASSSSSKVQKSGKSSNSQPKHKVRRDSESDWEEVQDGDKQHQLSALQKYKGDIQVTVELPQYQKLKKKNAEEIEASLKRRINRVIKENQLNLHKVSFLCHLANGIYTNKILNDPRLMSETIKLLPNDKYCYPNGPTDMKYFGSFIKWYKNTMSLKYDGMYSNFRKRPPLQKSLALQIKCKSAICKKDYVLIFIVLLRAMGIQCRLVVNLVTLPIKPLQNDLCSLKQKSPNDKKKLESDEKQVANTKKPNKHDNSSKNSTRSSKTENLNDLEEDIGKKQNLKKKLEKKALPSTSRSHNSKSSPHKNSNEKNMEKSKKDSIDNDNSKFLADKVKDTKSKLKLDSNSKVEPINEQNTVRRTTRSKGKNTLKRTSSPENEKLLEQAKKPKQSNDQITENKNRQRSKRACQLLKDNPVETDEKSRKRMKKNDDSEKQKQTTSKRLVKSKTSIPQMDGADDISTTKSSKNKTKKSSATNRGSKKKQFGLKKLDSSSKEQNDSADEFTLSFKNKVPLTKSKLSSKLLENVKRSDRRVLSTDDDEPDSSGGDENKKNKNKMDIWIEIFSESDDRWIACDIFKSKVDCVESLRKSATSPIAYVYAWNNNNTLKDVSARYCPQWNTVTRKLRVDQEWIDEAIKNYLGKKTARDTAEDRELHIMHLEKPLPTTISEYKNHPLYALERHLLKFEVIYPPNALTLGFVRGEPVYARECVHVCHSREIWLKSARVVKLGETPYKIVKARPKWDRMTQSVIKDQPLEIFGYWQTQQYEPPTAENGIVPRNAYGNVELFKKCMLPKKTVHLQLPGISRICKKLNIDCAPAVIGFDFHQGLCHPLLDGFVICEEFKDKVLDAWNREQEEAEKREEEKYYQRVYGNWKKLIKGLLIKQKLKLKYNF